MKVGANFSREDLAGVVFDVLMTKADPATLREIAGDADISTASARRGIGYIREILADEREQPIVYVPRNSRSDGGYKLALIEREIYPYIRQRYSIALTQLERLRSATVSPAMRKFAINGIKPYQLEELSDDLATVEKHIRRLLRHLPNGQLPLKV